MFFELAEVDSTQEFVKRQWVEQPDLQTEFFYVWAKHQTQGRGTHGREWASLAGNLNLSVFWPLKKHVSQDLFTLPLHVGIVLFNCIQNAGFKHSDLWLKWPNDLWFGADKLGGILCERIEQGIVIGIGLNLNEAPALKTGRATSLKTCAESLNLEALNLAPDYWAHCISKHINNLWLSSNLALDASMLRQNKNNFKPPVKLNLMGEWFYQDQKVELIDLNEEGSFKIKIINSQLVLDVWSAGLEFCLVKGPVA